MLQSAGTIETLAGKIPQVATTLVFQDKRDSVKARLGINRMDYNVSPGLYCVGAPDQTSIVLVTANYKMSFDYLRRELSGRNAWILVLDTKGINVWCAAGKGTFSTDELVQRMEKVNLAAIVSHRTVILPQLAAPGVAAHEVQKRSGFKVVYGPVRSSDLPAFLDAGMKATSAMRAVRFELRDRIVLTPIELVMALKLSLSILGVLFVLNLLGLHSFGLVDLYAYMGSLVIGCVLMPALLPWIPGKAFAWKGWLLGLFWAVGVNVLNGWPGDPVYGPARAIAYLLILPAISAFYAVNFTGSSTYTSLSGVQKEMKYAIPAIVLSMAVGAVLLLFSN